jgi:hypothetical protein
LYGVDEQPTWSIKSYSNKTDSTKTETIKIDGGRVKVSSLYLSNQELLAFEAQDKNKNIIANFPIYIGQNQHSSRLLNDWNGSLTVNETDNYILSAMVGAGRKNDDNTFTGVIMGDYGKLDSNNAT